MWAIRYKQLPAATLISHFTIPERTCVVRTPIQREFSSEVFLPEFMPALSLSNATPLQRRAVPKKFVSFKLLPAICLSLCLCFPSITIAADEDGEFGSAIDFTMYKLATEQNDASAQYLVGRNFLKGKTVTKNVGEAIKWFKRASKQNHQRAQFTLGKIYYYGTGIKRNKNLGLNYIEKAAENGMDEAQLFLGNFYLTSKRDNSRAKARKWLLAAAEYNNPRAQFLVGKVMLESGKDEDNAKAAEWLQRASEAGILEAGQLLSRLRIDGKGLQSVSTFPTNPSVESSSLPKMENNGETKAASNSASKKIAKVKVDPSISMPPLMPTKQAARDIPDNLTPKKQFNLAMDYINGEHGVKQNLRRGIDLLVLSAQRNYPSAQYTYGLMLRDGAGVEKDLPAALSWLEKAAHAGLSSAKREYDNLKLRTMIGKDNNPVKPARQFNLGLRLLKGDGLRKDEKEAAKWILKAAKQNHHEAEAKIGSMYKDGIGLARNEKQAIRWLEKAANAGVLSAARELKELRDKHVVATAKENSKEKQKEKENKKEKNLAINAKGDALQKPSFLEKVRALEKPIAPPTKKAPKLAMPDNKNTTKNGANNHDSSHDNTGDNKENNNHTKPVDLASFEESNKPISFDKTSPLYPSLVKAQAGDTLAQYEVALKLLQQKAKTEEGLKWLKKAADNKFLPAQVHLGDLYLSGTHLERDVHRAYELFFQAANAGDPYAQFMLGDLYKKGIGVNASNSEAIRWYRKSANQGNKEARHRLGGCRIC